MSIVFDIIYGVHEFAHGVFKTTPAREKYKTATFFRGPSSPTRPSRAAQEVSSEFSSTDNASGAHPPEIIENSGARRILKIYSRLERTRPWWRITRRVLHAAIFRTLVSRAYRSAAVSLERWIRCVSRWKSVATWRVRWCQTHGRMKYRELWGGRLNERNSESFQRALYDVRPSVIFSFGLQ